MVQPASFPTDGDKMLIEIAAAFLIVSLGIFVLAAAFALFQD